MHPFPSATENTSQETVTVQVMKCVQRELFSNRKNIPLNSSSKTKTESDERCTEIIYLRVAQLIIQVTDALSKLLE